MPIVRRIFLTVYVWSPIGGTEQNVTSLACALKRAGYDVVVLAWAYVADQPTTYETTLREAGVRFISTNSFVGRLAFRWEFKVEVINRLVRVLTWPLAPVAVVYAFVRQCSWRQAVSSMQGRMRAGGLNGLQGFTADRYMSAWLSWLHWLSAVSVLNQHLTGTPTAMQWARQRHVPVVYTEACLPDDQNAGMWKNIQPELQCAQVVVAASPAVKGAIVTYTGVEESRIVIIPNTVEFTAQDAIRAPVPPRDNGVEILFVGRLDPMKGVDVLLEAAALLKQCVPGWRLSIIGDGQLAGELRRQAETLDLNDYVTFKGRVDHANLPAHFASAWVLAAPSRHTEGFGMAVAEALSFGLPVVASDLPAFRSLVVSGQNGMLVPPEDPQALADVLAQLILHPAERERLRPSGPAGAEANAFHPDVVARQFTDAYDQAVHQAAHAVS